jgi:hypothetical protein
MLKVWLKNNDQIGLLISTRQHTTLTTTTKMYAPGGIRNQISVCTSERPQTNVLDRSAFVIGI